MRRPADPLRSFPTSVSFPAFLPTNLYSVSRCPSFHSKELLNSNRFHGNAEYEFHMSSLVRFVLSLPLSKSLQAWLDGPGPGVDKTSDFYGNGSKSFMHVTHVDRCIDLNCHWTVDLKESVAAHELVYLSAFARTSPQDVCRRINVLINLLWVEYIE